MSEWVRGCARVFVCLFTFAFEISSFCLKTYHLGGQRLSWINVAGWLGEAEAITGSEPWKSRSGTPLPVIELTGTTPVGIVGTEPDPVRWTGTGLLMSNPDIMSDAFDDAFWTVVIPFEFDLLLRFATEFFDMTLGWTFFFIIVAVLFWLGFLPYLQSEKLPFELPFEPFVFCALFELYTSLKAVLMGCGDEADDVQTDCKCFLSVSNFLHVDMRPPISRHPNVFVANGFGWLECQWISSRNIEGGGDGDFDRGSRSMSHFMSGSGFGATGIMGIVSFSSTSLRFFNVSSINASRWEGNVNWFWSTSSSSTTSSFIFSLFIGGSPVLTTVCSIVQDLLPAWTSPFWVVAVAVAVVSALFVTIVWH